MNKTGNRSLPWWLFAILAIGGLLASGIFIGVMSVEGVSTMRIAQTVGFGLLGIIMFWGAIQTR